MIKSFSGQVVFCFAILRAISAYVGENWLSQYTQTPYSHSIHILTVNHYSSINESPHHLSAFYICK